MSTETQTKTVVKCDHCHKVRVGGLCKRTVKVEIDHRIVADFEADLCSPCATGFAAYVMNYFKAKLAVPEAKTTLGSLGGM